jgi:WD40 repeat protein
VLRDHTGPVTALELGTVDSSTLLVSGSRDGTVRLWDPVTGSAMGEPLLGHSADVERVIMSNMDNRPLVFAASHSHITGWDLRSRRTLDLESFKSRRWSVLAIGHADGRPVAIVQADDNSVLRWDILSGSEIGDPLIAHTDYIDSAVIGIRDGIPVALTSSQDMTVRTWDLRNGHELGPPLARELNVQRAMAIGPTSDETVAITIGSALTRGGGNQVRLWSLRTFQQIGEPLCGVGMDVDSLAVGTTGGRTVIVCGCNDGPVRIRDLNSGQRAGPLLNGHWSAVRGTVVTDLDGPVAITAADSTVRVWDLMSYRERSSWKYAEGGGIFGRDVISLLTLSGCDGRQRVITTAKAVAYVWDAESRTHLTELAGHTGDICAIAAAECGDVPMVLTGSRDGTARLWDARTFKPVCAPLSGHDGDVNAVAFGELDGRPIAFTGDDGGAVHGWDPRTGDKVDLPTPEARDWVSALTFGTLRDEPTLAIGAADGTVRLWSGSTRETIAEIQLHTAPRDMVIHPDGYLCVATAMGVVALRFGDGP